MTPRPQTADGWRGGVLTLALAALAFAGCSPADENVDVDAFADLCAPPDTFVLDAARPDTALDAVSSDTGVTDLPPCGLPLVRLELAAGDWRALHADEQGRDEYACSVELAGRRFVDARIELHGGYARTVPKKSYRLRLPEEDGEDPELAIFGERPEEHRRFVLQASWIDPTFARNHLTLDLARQLGGLAPRVTWVSVCANDEWLGLYALIERVDKLFLRKRALSRDGNLYKAENHHANWRAKGNALDGYDQELREGESYDDLTELLDALSHTPASYERFQADIEPLLSLRDHAAWTMAHVFAMDRDAFTKNYYLHHDPALPRSEPAGRFRIISWDADATFALNWNGDPLPADDEKWHGHDGFSPRLYGIPEYRRDYLERFRAALDDGPLRVDALLETTAALRERLAVCAGHDERRWERRSTFSSEMNRLDEALRVRHSTMSGVVDRLLEAARAPGT